MSHNGCCAGCHLSWHAMPHHRRPAATGQVHAVFEQDKNVALEAASSGSTADYPEILLDEHMSGQDEDHDLQNAVGGLTWEVPASNQHAQSLDSLETLYLDSDLFELELNQEVLMPLAVEIAEELLPGPQQAEPSVSAALLRGLAFKTEMQKLFMEDVQYIIANCRLQPGEHIIAQMEARATVIIASKASDLKTGAQARWALHAVTKQCYSTLQNRRIRCDGYLYTEPEAWFFMDGEQVTGPSANLLSWAMDQARAVPYHLFIESVINATVKGAASQRDRRGGGKYRALLERLGYRALSEEYGKVVFKVLGLMLSGKLKQLRELARSTQFQGL